jgi:hypothetical protein
MQRVCGLDPFLVPEKLDEEPATREGIWRKCDKLLLEKV